MVRRVEDVILVELGLVQSPLVGIGNGRELYQVILCIAVVHLHVGRGSGQVGRRVLTIWAGSRSYQRSSVAELVSRGRGRAGRRRGTCSVQQEPAAHFAFVRVHHSTTVRFVERASPILTRASNIVMSRTLHQERTLTTDAQIWRPHVIRNTHLFRHRPGQIASGIGVVETANPSAQ